MAVYLGAEHVFSRICHGSGADNGGLPPPFYANIIDPLGINPRIPS